jgi:hypothetical protein
LSATFVVASRAAKIVRERSASVKTAAKISEAGSLRGGGGGRLRRRRRESVGPICAFCASKCRRHAFRKALPQNFFGLVNPLLWALIVPAKARASGAPRMRAQQNFAPEDATKARISSALLQRMQILFARVRGGKISRRSILRKARRVRTAAAGRGAYTQN